MAHPFIIFLTVSATLGACAGDGPNVWRSPNWPRGKDKGEVWPKPQHQVKKNRVLIYDQGHFQIKVVGVTCSLLLSAISRHSLALTNLAREHALPNKSAKTIDELHVELTTPCDEYPYPGMSENYELKVAKVSYLSSTSVWGVLRGLQTLLHLFYFSQAYNYYKDLVINETEIVDYPRYSHRGLLLDTTRHFVSLPKILLTLDAMEMNKMNVFHWHIVGDDSFPYQSLKFPELSNRAAFEPSKVYSKSDIALVVDYARDRGIRVVPEFDVPVHMLSWNASHPEIVLTCRGGDGRTRVVLNPVHETTYNLLRDLFQEVRELFRDQYFYIGGDEVDMECWESDPNVQAYLKENDIKMAELYPKFMKKILRLLGNKQPVVWQEVFENMLSLPDGTPVQIGKPARNDVVKNNVNKVLEAGKKVILSSPWELDDSRKSWEDYYTSVDLRGMVDDASLVEHFLGGEACIRNEDEKNLYNRLWPRASAVAEVLWSWPPAEPLAALHSATRRRLAEQSRRMTRNDIFGQTEVRMRAASTTVKLTDALFAQIFLFCMFM